MSSTISPGQERAAVRKVIYRLSELDGEEADADEMDILEAANKALENVADLQARVETLEVKFEELDERAPSPDRKAYDQMDRADKATVVRSKLRSEAEATNGTASMQYKDVVRTFDGNPSAGHAYDIMETAAKGDGYALGTNGEGRKRLTFAVARCE